LRIPISDEKRSTFLVLTWTDISRIQYPQAVRKKGDGICNLRQAYIMQVWLRWCYVVIISTLLYTSLTYTGFAPILEHRWVQHGLGASQALPIIVNCTASAQLF
jgi:hypothetical protein